jgi:hypothetical protein
MRIVTLAAVALLASAGESAIAMSLFGSASCNKGVLWPYVRAPGDCLTDAEIAAGQRGTYNGPTETNPDVGAIAPPQQETPNGIAAPAPAADPLASAPAPMAAPVSGTQAQTPVAAPAAQIPVAAAPGMQTVTEFSCSKGLLWPFRRSAGDCLTAAEKRRGMTGVYGGGTGLVVTQVPAPAPQVVYQQAPQTQPVPQVVYQQAPQVQPGQQVIYQQVPQTQPVPQVVHQQAPQVQPGQQDIYQQAPQTQPVPQVVYQQVPQVQPGQQTVYQQLPAGAVVDGTGQVVMVQPAPPPQQAAAAGCTKGALWPFIKKPGDCESSSLRRRR